MTEAIVFGGEGGVIFCGDNVRVFGADVEEGLTVTILRKALHGVGAMQLEGVGVGEIVPELLEFESGVEVSF